LTVVFGGAAALLFAIVVWPTPWRHEKVMDRGSEIMLRVHRLTGEVQRFRADSGWVRLGPRTSRSAPATLPAVCVQYEARKLQRAGVAAGDPLDEIGQPYNASADPDDWCELYRAALR
jgi:hypothetical protein